MRSSRMQTEEEALTHLVKHRVEPLTAFLTNASHAAVDEFQARLKAVLFIRRKTL